VQWRHIRFYLYLIVNLFLQVENMADQAYFNNLEQECAREKKEKGKRIEEAVG